MGWVLGLGNGVVFRTGGGSSYWTQQTLLKYGARSNLDIIESVAGRNAKIIPSCGLLTTAVDNNYARRLQSGFGSADATGYLEFRGYFGVGIIYYPFASTDESRADRYFYLMVNETKVIFGIRDIAGTPSTPKEIETTESISEGFHTVRLISDGSIWTITVDGTDNPVVATYGTNTGLWLNFGTPNFRDNILIGAVIITTPAYSTLGYINYVDYNNSNKWVVNGEGKYIYDLIGTSHLTWSGSNHIAYIENAGQELLNDGFSIWTKAGEPDEFVSYKSGSAFDVSAFLTGYSKLADYPGGVTIYNYAPSLVDFDYTDTTHTDLVVLDKSNSTYHIATAGMNYYDAVNPYRWRQDELASPQIYSDTYKNVGYKGMMMIKGTVASSLVKDMSEIYVLRTDQAGDKEWRLAQLCTLEDLVVQAGGLPVFDGDNYLTWI
jgi:hypothetical protein